MWSISQFPFYIALQMLSFIQSVSPGLYGLNKQQQQQQHTYPPNVSNMTGLTSGFQGLALHSLSSPRGGVSNTTPVS